MVESGVWHLNQAATRSASVIHSYEVDTGLHQSRDEMNIAGEAIQLGDYQPTFDPFRMGDGLCQFRAVLTLTALDLGIHFR